MTAGALLHGADTLTFLLFMSGAAPGPFPARAPALTVSRSVRSSTSAAPGRTTSAAASPVDASVAAASDAVASPPAATGAVVSPPAATGTAQGATDGRQHVTYRVRSGAEVDLGWTGIAHHQPWPSEQRLSFTLDCRSGSTTCAAGGGERGALFSPPIPLSAGGISVCVVNRLREPIGGTADPRSGCGELQLRLTSSVVTAPSLARPCPVCAGDPTPNDGRKDGRCDAGPARGTPCDAQSMSTIFGPTSSDCLPPGSSVGELAIDLTPLTTGAVRRDAGIDCRRDPGRTGRCFCAGQSQPNACDGGTCGNAEICEEGPADGVCAKAPFRSCGMASDDCNAGGIDGGACELHPRPCFGGAIVASGTCNPETPTYVAAFCTPATRAAALNATAGLPGPARLVLPLERVGATQSAVP